MTNTETDYQRFTREAEEMECEFVQILGYLHHAKNPTRYEAWLLPNAGPGFILATDEVEGTVGIYHFSGISGEPVDNDIQRLCDKVLQEEMR